MPIRGSTDIITHIGIFWFSVFNRTDAHFLWYFYIHYVHTRVHECMHTLNGWIYSPPSRMLLLDWNILFSYWNLPFKVTLKPLYVTYWWSNHFTSECQIFYKITANELVPSIVSWGSVPRTQSYVSTFHSSTHLLCRYRVSCGGQHSATGNSSYQEISVIVPLHDVKKESSHLPILPNLILSCHTPISFTFSWGSRECEKLSFRQQCDCPLLPQRRVAFVFTSEWRKVWDVMGNHSWREESYLQPVNSLLAQWTWRLISRFVKLLIPLNITSWNIKWSSKDRNLFNVYPKADQIKCTKEISNSTKISPLQPQCCHINHSLQLWLKNLHLDHFPEND